MDIKNGKTGLSVKLTAARLYVDDIEAIACVLEEAYAQSSFAHPEEKPEIRFWLKDKTYGSIEDLRELRGKVSSISILVGMCGTDVGVCSFHLTSSGARWILLGTDEAVEWKVYGKLLELFLKRKPRRLIRPRAIAYAVAFVACLTLGITAFIALLRADAAIGGTTAVNAMSWLIAAGACGVGLRYGLPADHSTVILRHSPTR
jgi:hypothetical protein